ncbi:ERF family protein [Photobacterium rosenbergii]|uniref:ERF family protein n=1 Tax=Photobacterium rosenbergii TaxID=294936 RepID=UPI001C992A77|nr:ERF family protein [Photobacterium rosenbergii]MBY5944777.1 ERF family protein [Photobacterium rosenbergii]
MGQVKQVYAAIGAVSRAMATQGVAKGRRNQQQGYNFRGIDDMYNALAVVLVENNLIIVPRMMGREVSERKTRSGANIIYTTVDVEYDFISTEDGSIHTAKTSGEGMDSGDKSLNKAMSAAYKYLVMQTFCIPLEGHSVDSENDTYQVQKSAQTKAKHQQQAITNSQQAGAAINAGLAAHQQSMGKKTHQESIKLAEKVEKHEPLASQKLVKTIIDAIASKGYDPARMDWQRLAGVSGPSEIRHKDYMGIMQQVKSWQQAGAVH